MIHNSNLNLILTCSIFICSCVGIVSLIECKISFGAVLKKILKQYYFFAGNSLSGNLNLKTLDLSANCIASLKVQFIVLPALTCFRGFLPVQS